MKSYFWIVRAKALTLQEMKVFMQGRTRKQAIDVFRKRNGGVWDSKNYVAVKVHIVEI